jgi:hypothetical protein
MCSVLRMVLKGSYCTYILVLVMAVCVIRVMKLEPKCTEVMSN